METLLLDPPFRVVGFVNTLCNRERYINRQSSVVIQTVKILKINKFLEKYLFVTLTSEFTLCFSGK